MALTIHPTLDQEAAELVLCGLDALAALNEHDDQEAAEHATEVARYVRGLLNQATRCPYCLDGTTAGGCCPTCRDRHAALRVWLLPIQDHDCNRGPF